MAKQIEVDPEQIRTVEFMGMTIHEGADGSEEAIELLNEPKPRGRRITMRRITQEDYAGIIEGDGLN